MNNERPEHLHLLEAGWDGFRFVYELEPADEIPAIYMGQHLIIIALDNFRASFDINGSWRHIDYAQGDIGIFPASQSFPKTQVDREVPIIDLFLDPTTLKHTIYDNHILRSPRCFIRSKGMENFTYYGNVLFLASFYS